MRVDLLFAPDHKDAVNILYAACRQCYYSGYIGDVYPVDNVSIEDKGKLIKQVISSGHHSVIEHISFTFSIGNVSRVMAQQLTRHRIGCSYSMQSQRYCDVSSGNIHIPESIAYDGEVLSEYVEYANSAVDFYKRIISKEKTTIEKEDIREILPIGWYTSLVMTMNCRELLHFFNERLCTNAQKEIRTLAEKMLFICQNRLPEVFVNAGPKCQMLGYCNEGHRSCHRKPLREDIFNIYEIYKNKTN